MKDPDLIFGGDLNLTLFGSEIWGGNAREDPLAPYFLYLFQMLHLIAVESMPLIPTCRNGKSGETRVAKRLDHFLLAKTLVEVVVRYKPQVEVDGISDHLYIFLQLDFASKKAPYPFKFNRSWLKEVDFIDLIKEHWCVFNMDSRASTINHITSSLKAIKSVVSRRNKKKKTSIQEELLEVERRIREIFI